MASAGGTGFGDCVLSRLPFCSFTDAHLEPELNAASGTAMAFRHARRVKADFAINGGDHVFDANQVSKERAVQLYDLYGKAEQDLGMKVYHTLGNHDVFAAVHPANSWLRSDPIYGKRLFEERFGKTYYSFDHKGLPVYRAGFGGDPAGPHLPGAGRRRRSFSGWKAELGLPPAGSGNCHRSLSAGDCVCAV